MVGIFLDSNSSRANVVFERCNLGVAAHDGLLGDRFLAFQLHDLSLHAFILFLLLNNARLKFFEVRHYIRVDDLHVLIILCREVILHQADFLS